MLLTEFLAYPVDTGATPSCCGVKFPIHILHDWQEANGIAKW